VAWIGLLLTGFAVGIGLGAVFFGSLWWTTARMAGSAHPARLITVSYLGRTIVLAIGLLMLARLDGLLLIGSLPGLIMAREALTRAATRQRLPVPGSIQEGRTSDGRA